MPARPSTGDDGPASTLESMLRPVGDHVLLTSRVEDALREAILRGDLPPGTHLSVPQVARYLGVSRTPAREALFALQRDGLVEVEPRRGAVVLRGGVDDLLELYDVREALDGAAARFAARRATEAQGARLLELVRTYREAVSRSATDEYVALDFGFHRTIVEAAANRRLEESLERILNQMHVVAQALALQERADMVVVLDEHTAIADAVVSGDADAAEAAARAHVRDIRDHAEAMYASAAVATAGPT